MTGVGLGPDQLAQVQTNIAGAAAYEVDASGLFVGHGGNLGVEVRGDGAPNSVEWERWKPDASAFRLMSALAVGR